MKTQDSGGQGGDGAITFLHGSAKELGPPNGGNGGRGGDVYIKSTKQVQSLHEIKESYRVPAGRNGQGKTMHGTDGEDLIIKVE